MTKKTQVTRRNFLAASAAAAGAFAVPTVLTRTAWAQSEGKPELKPLPDNELEQIEAALPEKATAEPKKPRRMLVFYRCEGFVNGAFSRGNAAWTCRPRSRLMR